MTLKASPCKIPRLYSIVPLSMFPAFVDKYAFVDHVLVNLVTALMSIVGTFAGCKDFISHGCETLSNAFFIV